MLLVVHCNSKGFLVVGTQKCTGDRDEIREMGTDIWEQHRQVLTKGYTRWFAGDQTLECTCSA